MGPTLPKNVSHFTERDLLISEDFRAFFWIEVETLVNRDSGRKNFFILIFLLPSFGFFLLLSGACVKIFKNNGKKA